MNKMKKLLLYLPKIIGPPEKDIRETYRKFYLDEEKKRFDGNIHQNGRLIDGQSLYKSKRRNMTRR